MAQQAIDELTFLRSCLKHSAGKPDFLAVANDLGITRSAAYHRHYHMAKKWNAGAGNGNATISAAPSGRHTRAANTTTSLVAGPATTQEQKASAKRGRKEQTDSPTKATDATGDEDSDDESVEDVPFQPAKKKAKIQQKEDEDDSDDESESAGGK